MMKRDLKTIIQQMTLEEKAGLCSGLDFWHTKAVDRLGIPSVMVCDGPHGLRKQDEKGDHLGINESIKAVCFPPAVLSACSFDRKLMEDFGDAIGKEAQANDVSVVLGPAVNIKRSPLCGRNFEYYSEDPYLTGETAAAFIKGVQKHHVGTSIKHFAANNQEFNRMSASSDVDERTLREIYLPGFETAVKEAQPKTVMCSYNRVNGVFASENPWLLTEVLRNEWGFEGYVMSDWGAVNDRVEALKAGLELEMPSSNGVNDAELIRAVHNGELSMEILDQAVERILNVVFDWTDHRETQDFTMDKDHDMAREIAENSMVLLKNEDRILPLSPEEKVVFIGGFAAHPRYQGGGSSHINSYKVSSALDAVQNVAEITYIEGFSNAADVYQDELARQAVSAAAEADKVVIFAGLPDSFESEGYDRSHMQLPACQNLLIREVLKVQPNVIVVLHNGAPVEMPWKDQVPAILEAYLGGQAVGEAEINILYGKVNPSGKLAETLPNKLSDNPSHLNFGDGEHVNYAEGIFVGYRYYDAKEMDVAFPFGHGLSYTSFSYDHLKVDDSDFASDGIMQVTVDVTNTGDRFGKEIVQLYIQDCTKACRRPLKELKEFEKVYLEPGETKTVTFNLDRRSFSWYCTDLHDWYAADGTYQIMVGASSRDIRQTVSVQLSGAPLLPLKLHANSTLGELISDPRSRDFGLEMKRRLDAFFGAGNGDSDEAVSDDMSMAVVASMPLRNVLTFGLISKEELSARLDELNRL